MAVPLVMLFVAIVRDKDLWSLAPALGLAAVSSGIMAWWGTRAEEIYLDGDDLLVMRGKDEPLRLPISGVTSVRCGYAVMRMRVMTFQHESGAKHHTLVREQDITWIMSRMPDRALTIYWRELIESGRTHF